jgi:hypothetical protein
MHREQFPGSGPSTYSSGSSASGRSSSASFSSGPFGQPPGRPAGDGSVDVPIEATETMPHVPVQPGRAAGPAGADVVSLPLGMALLVVSHGPNRGARFLLDREVIVAGRHPDSDVFLDDVTVSRAHAEFRRGPDGRFTIVDTGSLNGTYVNRERVPMADLRSGDEIQIGKFRLTFMVAERPH